MVVTNKVSNTHFVLADVYNPQATYQRSIANIRRWIGPIPDAAPSKMSKPAEAGDIEVGNVVVAREDASATKLDVAEVTSITDETVTLACFGTRSASPKAAKFHEVYTDGPDVFLGKLSRNKTAT